MSQMPQYPTDKERLARIETILENLSAGMSRLEASITKHIADSVIRESDLESRIDALADAEGESLKVLKRRILDYILFAALGGALTYFATIISKVMST